jgi:hypothetical protein
MRIPVIGPRAAPMLDTVRMSGILLQFTGPIHTDDEEDNEVPEE